MALTMDYSRRRVPVLSALALTLTASLLVALWYAMPVRSVEVTGNKALSKARVAELAGASADFGWLYYGAWRARQLERHAWVREAVITRVFPDTIMVQVSERTPAARVVRGNRSEVIAWDGVVLPGAKLAEPVIRGWGPDRTGDALAATRLLARYNVKSVDYTPSGLTIKTASGTVWSGSLVSLQKYAASVTMNAGKRVNIYPWGVSVQE